MDDLASLRASALAEIAAAATADDVEKARVRYLGQSGVVKGLTARIKEVPVADRPAYAARVNKLKDELAAAIAARKDDAARAAREERFRREAVDITLPGDVLRRGSVHAVTRTEEVLIELMRPLGFTLVDGPEVETEYFCFDSLNIPKNHPARDMQDTFYVRDGVVLRTHTTSVQARVLATGKYPVKVMSIGRVYRNEKVDAQHLALFHQFECIWVEEGLTFAHLKGLLGYLTGELYGRGRAYRFKPKYYPYTEPSAGLDVACMSCGGRGEAGGAECPACGGAGWITMLGSGMVHRKVLAGFGYDPEKVQGIAFGMGTSRMAAQRHGIDKLRALYDNDLRTLAQLAR